MDRKFLFFFSSTTSLGFTSLLLLVKQRQALSCFFVCLFFKSSGICIYGGDGGWIYMQVVVWERSEIPVSAKRKQMWYLVFRYLHHRKGPGGNRVLPPLDWRFSSQNHWSLEAAWSATSVQTAVQDEEHTDRQTDRWLRFWPRPFKGHSWLVSTLLLVCVTTKKEGKAKLLITSREVIWPPNQVLCFSSNQLLITWVQKDKRPTNYDILWPESNVCISSY